jgi:hypothetical protein
MIACTDETPNNENAPVVDAFLDFLAHDMTPHPPEDWDQLLQEAQDRTHGSFHY